MDYKLLEQMNKIYSENNWEDIPWNFKRLPETLRNLIDEINLKPCKTLDVGCGSGNYSNWLAENGFTVTGIDLSDQAIVKAREKYKSDNLNFICGDFLDDEILKNEKFDFIFDWQVLHHIFPEDRERYIKKIKSHLDENGIYVSVCFSEENKQFGGKGKYRKTFFDTELYFSSEEEINVLLKKYFKLVEVKTITIPGKKFEHKDVLAIAKGF